LSHPHWGNALRHHKFIHLAMRLVGCLLLLAACDTPAARTSNTSAPRPSQTTQLVAQQQQQQYQAVAAGATSSLAPTASRTSSVASNCIPAADVTTNDVGGLLCVTGTVKRAYATDQATFAEFGTPFYLLSYELDLTAIPRGVCVEATGKVQQVGSHAVIVVSHKAPPTDCAVHAYLTLPRFSGVGSPSANQSNPPPQPVNQPPPPQQPPSANRYRIGATCVDGWPSSATGSGACSHHGGVSCWRYSDGTCTKP
jgi:hypothetical protein